MGSYQTRNRKFQKNSKKIQKIRKHLHSLFSSQNTLGMVEKERKLNNSFWWAPTWPVIENSKKIAKKFKKLENTTKAYFQAKISWKRPRKRENKNKKSFRCVPSRPIIERSKKNTKKIQKIRKHHHSFFSSQNKLEKDQKEWK